MQEVLKEIQERFCPVCKVGAPSKLIGYKSSGTCLDYIYDNFKVPYSLAWEIYSNEVPFYDFLQGQTIRNERTDIDYTFMNNKENNKDQQAKLKTLDTIDRLTKRINSLKTRSNISNMKFSNFLQIEQDFKLTNISQLLSANNYASQPKIYSSDENEMCVKLFNPLTKSSYSLVIEKWTKALVYLLNYVKIN
jgi:hypothetical protein